MPWSAAVSRPAAESFELLVDDKVVATVSGENQNVMTRKSFNVAEHEGREARLRIVDKGTQGWGNIGVDYIVFSDVSAAPVRLHSTIARTWAT